MSVAKRLIRLLWDGHTDVDWLNLRIVALFRIEHILWDLRQVVERQLAREIMRWKGAR